VAEAHTMTADRGVLLNRTVATTRVPVSTVIVPLVIGTGVVKRPLTEACQNQ
jgi:hypothetical protein